jgi:hypothetical protein
MTQEGVKEYMAKYLATKKYEVINEDGFLYAKGDVPVLLVAHMDTVHKELCTSVIRVGNKFSSPQGIGGDDRCGVFIIANLVKSLHCSVLLLEDEEIGTVGARKFTKTDYINTLDVNFMIEFDRKGNNDAVFYSCDNEDFTNHVLDNTGYKLAQGSFTDISVLMPASKLCGVNLSCGYYNPHTTNEYVNYDEMLDTISAAKALIKAECEKPFEYVAKTYSPSTYNSNYRTYGGSSYGYYPYSSYYGHTSGNNTTYGDDKDNLRTRANKDVTLELTVTIINKEGQEEFLFAEGRTKGECWLDLFTSYPGVCFNDILEYEFT